MAETETISLDDAHRMIAGALLAAGVSDASAQSVARALVAAEAEGQVGHGFSRVADYVAQVRSGKVDGRAEPQFTQIAPALGEVDAGHGFAFPALDRATTEAARMSQEQGAGCVAVTRSHHCGALSIQVEKIARTGAVAMMFANAPSAIAPWGAKTPLYGTNPIAFACPVPNEASLVADLSMSRVARGKIMNAKKKGEAIPDTWALDRDGNPTTDAEAALQGSMLPIGGAKGTVLAMIVEILAAAVTSANLSPNVSSFFDADGPPPGTGQLLIAFRPPNAEGFGVRIRTLLEMVLASEGARLPGTRRRTAIAASARDGLTVPTAYLDPLRTYLN